MRTSEATKLPAAVILAGGLGTRIRHMLDGRPKPLAAVAGKPFLEWIIRFLAKQGVDDIVVSAGYKAEMLSEFCASLPLPEMHIRSVAETAPQGTAGGFLEAIDGDAQPAWLVCNGDSLICAGLAGFAAELASDAVDGALMALQVPDGSRYGNLRCDAESNLIGFDEKTAGSGLINAGVYLLRARLLCHFPKKRPLSFETEVFPALLKAGARIRVYKVQAPFIDIGTEVSLGQAQTFIETNKIQFL